MLCSNDTIHTDPYFNLAAEEYMLKNCEDNCFLLWRNEPSVIVGRHQNTLAEINTDYVKEKGIKVVRRLSGGGAVFHDLGNINFTFIEHTNNQQENTFVKYTQPIIAVLQNLGIDARFEGRNDIAIDGKKISGNAEFIYRDRILHHGTLLYASELTDLSDALRINPLKYQDKAVKSVQARVTNISSHLKSPLGLDEFRNLVLQYMMKNMAEYRLYTYSAQDIEAIRKLRDEKYATWEWNFGRSPGYSIIQGKRTAGGYVEVHSNVENGIICGIRIMGDFFHLQEISELEEQLIHLPHDEIQIRKKLQEVKLSNYLVNVSIDDLISIMF